MPRLSATASFVAASFVAIALAGAGPAAAHGRQAQDRQAQDRQAETGRPPERIRDVTLQGSQRCPASTPTEVVVCHRNDEPYRIPKALRDDGPVPAANQSWVNRTAVVDQVGRAAGGLPDTCSAVGTGGQSGCALAQNQAWAAEQRARRNADAALPAASAAAAGDTRGTVGDQ